MMAQNDLAVVGIDVAKDLCIQVWAPVRMPPKVAWWHQRDGRAAVTSVNRKVLHDAGIEVRIVDPKRVRHFAQSADGLPRMIQSMLR